MHIALVTHRFVRGDGQGRVNLEVARAASRRGWRVSLLASEVTPELLTDGDVRWIPVKVAGWPTELVRNQVFALASWSWLARHRHEIDVIVVNGFITWATADVAAAHFVHAAWLGSRYRPRARSLRGAYQRIYTSLNARLERRAYRRAGRVVAVSEQVRQQLIATGVKEDMIDVIPNGVDTREFSPSPEQGGSRSCSRDVTALFVGDLQTSRKNLYTVLRALVSCPTVALTVAGSVGGSPYPGMAERLGIADRVRFLGFRSDLPELMRSVDFVIFPSLYEPCGLVLLEAMASGRPIITARTVGGLEVADPACALVLEDPEDTAAMAAAIGRLGSSEALREEMGVAGRRQALRQDFGLMAERYCELFARQRRLLLTLGQAGFADPLKQGRVQPRVTICICTRNRPVELRRCLDSISRSTVAVDQVVVSDDSTDGRTAELLRGSGGSVVYVEGPKSGLGANRNRALYAATGDYILFLDDDACLGEAFLERALACATAHGSNGNPCVIVTGCENNYGTIVRAHDQSFLGFQAVPYRASVGLKTIVINSTLFPRALFDVVRFDENLVYGYDEVDIASQAISHGYRIVHADDAMNFHYPSTVNRAYYKPHMDVSRLYVTFKRYAVCEQSYLKAAGFALLAPVHCLAACAKRRGLSGLADACRTIAAAAHFSADALRTSRAKRCVQSL